MMNQTDSKRVAAHFRRSIPSYDAGAQVQKEVGDYLVSRLGEYPDIGFQRVLEIGCCTGSMTACLCRTWNIDELWVNDLVPECCERTAARVAGLAGAIYPLAGDIETLAIPANLQLVVSSSTFQWLHDLGRCLAKFSTALAEHGYLVFSMFGPGTMQQVQALTGVGLRYTTEGKLAEMLQPNYRLMECRTSRHKLFFNSPKEVLRHIQSTGVGGAGTFRWTPAKLRQFEKDYRRRFGEEQGVPLDYVSIFVVAQKQQG